MVFTFRLSFVTFLFVFGLTIEISYSTLECEKFQFNLEANVFDTNQNHKIFVISNFASCTKCSQKLNAFKALKLRFNKADYDDIIFIALVDETDIMLEAVKLNNIEKEVKIMSSVSCGNHLEAGAVYVFDYCLRLTYKLIPPWTESMMIKAAILSTLYDSPCGKCLSTVQNSSEVSTAVDYIDNAASQDTTDVSASSSFSYDVQIKDSAENSTYRVPLKFIIPLEHVHRMEDKKMYTKYNFLVLMSNDSSYHGHLPNDKTDVLYESNVISLEKGFEDRNVPNLINSDGATYKPISMFQNGVTREFHEVISVESPAVENFQHQSTSVKNISGASYGPLFQWLSFRLIDQN